MSIEKLRSLSFRLVVANFLAAFYLAWQLRNVFSSFGPLYEGTTRPLPFIFQIPALWLFPLLVAAGGAIAHHVWKERPDRSIPLSMALFFVMAAGELCLLEVALQPMRVLVQNIGG